MLEITKELRDVLVDLLSGVKGDTLALNLQIKGLITSLKELSEIKKDESVESVSTTS